MKKISKINQLVLRGLLAEDQEKFLTRLALLTQRGNADLLTQLADGIIVDVHITDEEAAKAWLTERYKSNGWTITSVTAECCNDADHVRICYTYEGRTKWFATQEKADRYSRGYSEDGVAEMDETHQFKGTYKSSSNDTVSSDKKWLEVEIL